MQIKENTVVTFEYTAVDENGKLIESSQDSEPMCYLHGNGRIAPGLEAAMEGKTVGDSFSVTLPPAQGFGEYDESLIHAFTREELSGLDEIEIGMQLQTHDDSGTRIFTISKLEGDKVYLDENHVLAGMTVSFDVTITDVRNATEEELGHGHAHSVHCTDDCGICDLHEHNNEHDHDCDCGCGGGCGHH